MNRRELKKRAKNNVLTNIKYPVISVLLTVGIPLLLWICAEYGIMHFVSENKPIPADFFTTAGVCALICSFIVAVFKISEAKVSLNLARGNSQSPKVFFEYFSNIALIIMTAIVKTIIILTGLLLFVLPGIYLMIDFSFSDFLIADDHDIDLLDALKRSHRMLKGHFIEMIVLNFSFLPWLIFGILTGVGLLWYQAYYKAAMAEVYELLKKSDESREKVLNGRNLY